VQIFLKKENRFLVKNPIETCVEKRVNH
jgi:hypothetical protein